MLWFFLIRWLSEMLGEARREEIQRERERDASPINWRPRTRAEAKQAEEDDEWLDKAEAYERARELKKALRIYRDLAKYSPAPDIVIKAKMGIKRVKRAQGG